MTVMTFTLLSLAAALALFECWMLFLVRHPATLKLCSRRIKNSIGHLYVFGERKIMQFMPGCGRHDEMLGYTLKPGTFIFEEREFRNTYHINSLGVRDSEEALDCPEIVIAGDSYAVGWGVNQEETFGKIIEKKTGRKILNTAVPSYGTAREMMMLRLVKTDRLKCLIIQYCSDDYEENKRFYLHNNSLQTMRPETFQRYMELHGQAKSYYFGKYLLLKLQKRIAEFKKPDAVAETPVDRDEAELFINALLQNRQILSQVRIIVFEMNGKNQTRAFTDALREKITCRDYPSFVKEMIILDMSKSLGDEHFYVLDDHLNPLGHEAVAEKLWEVLTDIDAASPGKH